jgi:5-methylcytosine-specific restriction endonuclease McrA
MNTSCKHCGTAISQPKLGRRRVFCSESCTQKSWALAHPEVIQARREANYAKHGERIRAKASEWQRLNPDRAKAKKQAWGKTENGKAYEKSKAHRRRSRILGNETVRHFTRAEFLSLCRATGCVCMECRKQFPIGKLEADHIIALSRGGSNGIGNIQPLCRSCNANKGDESMNWLTDYALEGVVLNSPAEYGVFA